MTALPATIAAEMTMTRQAASMSIMKSNAEAQQEMAQVLENAVENLPTSPVRGTNVDMTA